MTTEVRETEQKYEVEGDVALPSFADLPQVAPVSEPEQETLTAEYYDTDDLRLLKAGITLRRREGGSDEGWHLKLPDASAETAEKTAGASSRREIRLTLDQGDRDRIDRRRKSGGDPVPAELARLVRAHARGAPASHDPARRGRDVAGRDRAGRGCGAEPGRVHHPVALERARDRADRRPPPAAAGGRRRPAPERAG